GQRLAMHIRGLARGDLRSKLRYIAERIAWLRAGRDEPNLFEHAPEIADMSIARSMNESANAFLDLWDRHDPRRYDGAMLIIRASIRDDMPGVRDDDPQLGWGDLVRGSIRVRDLAAEHNDMLAAEHAGELATILLEYLPDPQPARAVRQSDPSASGQPETAR